MTAPKKPAAATARKSKKAPETAKPKPAAKRKRGRPKKAVTKAELAKKARKPKPPAKPKVVREKCAALSKQSGERCGRYATDGKTVCVMHGGRSPSGVASASFITGYYSSAMPSNLADKYMEALKDPELIELRREAALSSALIARGLARLDTGESGTHWQRLQKAWETYGAATKAEDRMYRLLIVGQLIEEGASAVEAERELRSAIVDKMRVAESERRRLVDASQVITAEELVAIVASLAAAINAEVDDRPTRERLLARFNRALSAGAERSAAAGV